MTFDADASEPYSILGIHRYKDDDDIPKELNEKNFQLIAEQLPVVVRGWWVANHVDDCDSVTCR